MIIKLNVYTDSKLKEVEKTYTAEDIKIPLGVIEDIMQYANLDIFEGGLDSLSEEGQIGEVVKMIVGSYGTFKNLIKDVFDGITDEELRRTDITEIAVAVIAIVKNAVSQLGSAVGLSSKRKN